MTKTRLNFLSSLIALAGGLILLAVLGTPEAMIWFIASLLWFFAGIYRYGNLAPVEFGNQRLRRRFWRLLLFS